MSKALVVAPHPDDETLGCGGTLLKHEARGDEVYWLIITNIAAKEGYDEEIVSKRQAEINLVAEEFGFKKTIKLDYPTTKLDTIPLNKIIKSVSDIIAENKPEIIYLPNRSDVHTDHKIIFDAVISSTKSFRHPFIKKILMYEVLSETEYSTPVQENIFAPNSFSDISDYLEKKISIMKIYKGEMRNHPFPRSVENIKALATFRGATAGVKYAEAFQMLKEIC